MSERTDSRTLSSFLLQNGLSIATVLAGVGTLVIDNVTSLPVGAIPKITLGLLCLLATSEIIDKSRRLGKIEQQISDGFADVCRRIGKDDIVPFHSSEEAHIYLTTAIAGAKRCIYHAAVGPGLERMRPEFKANQYAATERKLKESAITYKYVTAFFETDRLERVQRWAEDPEIRRYYVAHYPLTSRLIPSIYFMTFDDSTAVVRFPRPAGELDEYVLFKDPTLVSFFVNYHHYLWQNAEIVKDLSFNVGALQTARARLGALGA